MINSNVFIYYAKSSHQKNVQELYELLGKLDLFLSIHHNRGDNIITSQVITERESELEEF